jgi:hypothetical protein
MKIVGRVSNFLRKLGILPKDYNYKESRPERGGLLKGPSCDHKRVRGDFTITVLGVECRFKKGLPTCATCSVEYLNKHSTICASCSEPIFPGNAVGVAWRGADHPYTHLTFECCDTGALYCGYWGEGELITLHQLDPKKYPEGTSSVVSHAMNTGQMVIENP